MCVSVFQNALHQLLYNIFGTDLYKTLCFGVDLCKIRFWFIIIIYVNWNKIRIIFFIWIEHIFFMFLLYVDLMLRLANLYMELRSWAVYFVVFIIYTFFFVWCVRLRSCNKCVTLKLYYYYYYFEYILLLLLK